MRRHQILTLTGAAQFLSASIFIAAAQTSGPQTFPSTDAAAKALLASNEKDDVA